MIVAAMTIADRGLRTEWTEDEWMRRFRGALRLRGMAVGVIRARERELRDALTEAGQAAYQEYGPPALIKLEADEAITAEWEPAETGPARKVYALTDVGRQRLADLDEEWRSFIAATDALRP